MIHILYRLTELESGAANRPAWYTKRECFYSLCVHANMPFTVYLEGGCDWLLQKANVKNVHLDKSESFIYCYRDAILLPEEDWVYFCEDDYLHVPEAMTKLEHCIEDVKPDLVSLYDHPDRYRDLPEHNLTNGKNDIFVSRDHHWRTVPSTCMTFAASVKCLKENQDLFEEWKHVDFELFPRILGLRGGERPKKYLMVGAMPSLATHCQLDYTAPVVDWKKYASLWF